MYVLLSVLSALLTYFIVEDTNKVTNYYRLTIHFIITSIINHLIMYLFLGSIDISHAMATITSRFMIKYLLMTVFTSILIKIVYLLIRKYIHIKSENYKLMPKLIKTDITLFILFFIILTCLYFTILYKNVPPEQLFFHLQVPIEGTSQSLITHFLLRTVVPSFIITFLLDFQYRYFYLNKRCVYLGIKNKQITILPFKYYRIALKVIIILLTIFMIVFTLRNYDVKGFITNQFMTSKLIEDEYVNPLNVDIVFPEKKRNLIYIYLESMETSYNKYTLNLSDLSIQNTNFSNNISDSGFYEITGTNWTIASMVAQTSGLPLKVSLQSSSYNVSNDSFLNGVSTLGEILFDNGYNNYLYMGSDASFAARDLYFTNHGNYEIFDYNSAREAGFISDDYYVWWGFEDKKLYEYSKQKLLEISKNDEPFNFTLLTVDSHPNDGYLDETCESVYAEQYANVISCADSMVSEFIKWIQEQSFYENTTIVVVGDHLYMLNLNFIEDGVTRKVYSTIINSPVLNANSLKREYSALDLFPTTIASLGASISQNKLGLGVNLYSDEPTLIEKYGLEYIDEELRKKSTFYQNLVLYQ